MKHKHKYHWDDFFKKKIYRKKTICKKKIPSVFELKSDAGTDQTRLTAGCKCPLILRNVAQSLQKSENGKKRRRISWKVFTSVCCHSSPGFLRSTTAYLFGPNTFNLMQKNMWCKTIITDATTTSGSIRIDRLIFFQKKKYISSDRHPCTYRIGYLIRIYSTKDVENRDRKK